MVLLQAILTDENVIDSYGIISEEWEDDEAQVLLKLIVELWITIHGFLFSATWMHESL